MSKTFDWKTPVLFFALGLAGANAWQLAGLKAQNAELESRLVATQELVIDLFESQINQAEKMNMHIGRDRVLFTMVEGLVQNRVVLVAEGDQVGD